MSIQLYIQLLYIHINYSIIYYMYILFHINYSIISIDFITLSLKRDVLSFALYFKKLFLVLSWFILYVCIFFDMR